MRRVIVIGRVFCFFKISLKVGIAIYKIFLIFIEY